MADDNDFVTLVQNEIKTAWLDVDKRTTAMGEVVEKLREEKADTLVLEGHLKDLQIEIKKATERTDEIERKANRAGLFGGSQPQTKRASELFAENEQFKSVGARGGKGTVSIELKTVISTPTAPAARNPLVTAQQAEMVTRVNRPLMVRDLIPVGQTNSQLIEYGVQGPLASAAAIVAEGALKPESAMTWTAAQAPVVTIAHWIPVSKQVYDDVPMLGSLIDTDLRVGLEQVEENQLLLGSGATGNMNGIYTQRTPYSSTGIPANANMVDHIRWAKLQVRKSFFPATAVVLNPQDWASIELLKDAGGLYLYSAVTTGSDPRLWGMRVVESDAMAVGTFMVGAFALAAKIWDREQANVAISSEDRDNFVRNMLTLRGEERLALTVTRPTAFVGGTFA